jgi:AraC-like DNA-binding protein
MSVTTMRRAIAFIEGHPHADISVADIAVASNVSIRAVQSAFRRQLDTTPMAYLRTVRLDRAHHDLLATDPTSGDRVTSIAARWGFYSSSRFAALYRHTDGVTPATRCATTDRSGVRRPNKVRRADTTARQDGLVTTVNSGETTLSRGDPCSRGFRARGVCPHRL